MGKFVHNAGRWTTVVMCLTSLTASNLTNCSRPSLPPPVPVVVKGFQEIDPENPPTEGVWATWDDARALALAQQQERLDAMHEVADLTQDNALLKAQMQAQIEANQQLTTGWRAWLMSWGLPLGLLCGLGLGVGIALGVK